MDKHKILIVEDDMVCSSYTRGILLKAGYLVSGVVNTGEDALKSISKEIPDMILMDIGLKGNQTGIELAGVIKENFFIPLIFITGSKSEQTISDAAEVEPYGFLPKPINPSHLISVIRISLKNHRIQQKYRASRLMLQSVFQCLSDAMFIIKLDTKEILKCNSTASQIFGYTEEEMIGKNIKDICGGEKIDEWWDSLVENCCNKSNSAKLFKKDGMGFYSEISISITNNEMEKEHFIVVMVRDITERKLSELFLKQHDDLLKSVLNISKVGTLMVDAQSNMVVDCNSFAQNLFQRTEDEIIGKDCFELLEPVEREKYFEQPGEIQDTNFYSIEICNEESKIILEDKVFPVTRSVMRIFRGGKYYYMEIFVDLSEVSFF
jgi:PAS domain S-box-containing protein